MKVLKKHSSINVYTTGIQMRMINIVHKLGPQSLTEEATNMQDCTMPFPFFFIKHCTQSDSGSIPAPNLAYFFAIYTCSEHDQTSQAAGAELSINPVKLRQLYNCVIGSGKLLLGRR